VKELDAPPASCDAETAEMRAFLAWAADHHFTFLGYRDYELAVDGEDQLRIVPRSGLGVLREPSWAASRRASPSCRRELRALAREPKLLVLTKANARSTVHRPGYLDYIGVKRFDAAGKVVGERRFVGLNTSPAYHADPREIPLLRRRWSAWSERAGFRQYSHMYKNCSAVLQGYPRDELFQIDDGHAARDRAGDPAPGATGRKDACFIRRDRVRALHSCLVYLAARELQHRRAHEDPGDPQAPPERHDRRVHGAPVEAVLARIHFLVRSSPGAPDYDVRAIEADIAQASRRWEDDLKRALSRRWARSAPRGDARVCSALSRGYRDR
jgi:glutamate dehydrogenase